jgi:hypothetical protein
MLIDHIKNFHLIEEIGKEYDDDLRMMRNLYGFYAYINCLNDDERDIELWKYDLTHKHIFKKKED